MATFPLFQVAFWSQPQKKCCPVAVADSSSLRTSHAAMPTNRPRISGSKLSRLADQPKGFLVPAASSHASDKGIISPDHQKISRKWSFMVLNLKLYSISSICFQELYMPSWGNIFSWLIPLKGETLNTSPLKPWKPYGLNKVVSWEPHQQRSTRSWVGTVVIYASFFFTQHPTLNINKGILQLRLSNMCATIFWI